MDDDDGDDDDDDGDDDDDDEMSVSLVEETGTLGGNHRPIRQVTDKLSHIRPVPSPSTYTELGPQGCEARCSKVR